MTKRQTRAFFLASTGFFSLIFIILTVDSHRQFPRLTHADEITPAVIAGKHIWHRKNCINCHTLLGEGAYYAPDLTKIAQQRGAAYLRSFLRDPSRFYSEERDRRLMPNQNLSDQQIDQLIAFLTWVSRIDTHGWPPRPILVSGAAIPGTNVGAPPQQPASTDPVAVGQALFSKTPPGCFACHSTAPGVNLVGPSLAGLADRASERIEEEAGYHGKATDAAGYIRESILHPNAYVVPGPTYSSNGQSLMPANFGEILDSTQVDALVGYLMTLK
jgi:nitric oxide reductase subunit C